MEITFTDDCVIERTQNVEMYKDLINDLFIKYVNEKFDKSVLEKRK